MRISHFPELVNVMLDRGLNPFHLIIFDFVSSLHPGCFGSAVALCKIAKFQFLLTSFSYIDCKETTLERADFTLPSAVNVCNRGKGDNNVYNFLSLHLLLAVVPTILT